MPGVPVTESPFLHLSLIVLTRKSGQISLDLRSETLYLPKVCSATGSPEAVDVVPSEERQKGTYSQQQYDQALALFVNDKIDVFT